NIVLAPSGPKSISAGKTISISTVGNTTIADGASISANPLSISANNGSISIIENAGNLSIGSTVPLTAQGVDFTANGNSAGFILLQEKTNSSTIPSGISIGANSTLNTNLINKNPTQATFPLPGQISVIIGTAIPTAPVKGSNPNPSNISVTGT